MSEQSTKRGKKISAIPDRIQNSKRKPNTLQKFEAQVSQETFLKENSENIDSEILESEVESYSKEIEEATEHLIEYDSEALDVDNDEDFGADKKVNIFDFSGETSLKKVEPDIVIDEIIPYNHVNTSKDTTVLDVFIPSKKRSLIRKDTNKSNKEYSIRVEALEKIGELLAEKDREFLLADVFNPAIIIPKKQKEIARNIHKDETWITRLKQSCIVSTPRFGLQPLSIFFPEETLTNNENYSMLVDHVNKEDPLNPLSIEDLASLISDNETDYRALTSNAGSKLRRIFKKLSIPPPQERQTLAKYFLNILNDHKDVNISEVLESKKTSRSNNIAKLTAKYINFSEKLFARLKNPKIIQ